MLRGFLIRSCCLSHLHKNAETVRVDRKLTGITFAGVSRLNERHEVSAPFARLKSSSDIANSWLRTSGTSRFAISYDLLRSLSFEYLVPLPVSSSANPLSVI